MHLYGHKWTRREIEARVGRLEQIGGLRRLRLTEGAEAGNEQIQLRTGAGLTIHISPSRCLDLSLAEFLGAPLSWQSASGDTHPATFSEGDPKHFLRVAAGGLLMTCGFTHAGAPDHDHGESLPLHGRAHHLAATQVGAWGEWQGDEYHMTVRGTVREARLFGENIAMTRTLRAQLGRNRLSIEDQFVNEAFHPSPFMVLYHFNFGFPLLTPDVEMEWPSDNVRPREETTAVDEYNRWHQPNPDIFERVFFHFDMETTKRPDGSKWAEARLRQPFFPLGEGDTRVVEAILRWDTGPLPYLVEWNMPGAGAHVLGIEPANCMVLGRTTERAAGRLKTLKPGEIVTHRLEFEVV